MKEFEVTNLKQELEKAKFTNQVLSTKIRKLETSSTPIVASMPRSNTSVRRGKEPKIVKLKTVKRPAKENVNLTSKFQKN